MLKIAIAASLALSLLAGCGDASFSAGTPATDDAGDVADPPQDASARGIAAPVLDAGDVADADAGESLEECVAAQCAWGGGSCGDITSRDPACPGVIHCAPCGGGGPDI